MLIGLQRRRGGQAWMWMLIGLILGGGAGAGAVYFLKQEKPSLPGGPKLGSAPELALVPADAIGFVHVRARDLWRSEFFGEFRKIIDKAGPENIALLDDGFAPKPSTLDRVTLVVIAGAPLPGTAPAANRDDPPAKGANGKLDLTPKREASKSLVDWPERIEPVVIMAFSAPFDAAKVRASIMPAAVSKQAAGKQFWEDAPNGMSAYFPNDTEFVVGTSFGVMKLVSKLSAEGTKPAGPLSGALDWASSGGNHLVAAFNASSIRFNLSGLKDEFRSLPANIAEMAQLAKDAEPLFRAEAFALGAAVASDNSKVSVRAYFKDDAAAEDGEKSVRAMAEFARKKLDGSKGDMEKALRQAPGTVTPRPIRELPQAVAAVAGLGALEHLEDYLIHPPLKRDGKELIASFDMPSTGGMYVGSIALGAGLMIPAVNSVRSAASSLKDENSLKQIGLAMLSYHDANGNFPLSSPLKGKGLGQLSWRVHILPFIEQGELYKQFKLDEAWDSPNNKKLIDKMPKIYEASLAPAPTGKTFCKVFTGGGAIFEAGKKRRLTDITDGTSNTILAVVGGQPVIWTKPDDIPFDPEKPLPDLSLSGNRKIDVLMADGSVRVVDLDRVSEATLKAAITCKGDDMLGADW